MMRMTTSSRWSATLMLSIFLLVAGCSARASNPVAPVTSSARTSASNPISQLNAARAGGEREGSEANEEGERGGEGGAQRLSITLSDSAIQPSTLTARAGLIEFDIVNHGQKVHTISVTGGEDQQNLGSVDPGK